jgi:4-amino-4-deoxy-L-arabinose transferase-like glycosyltransferase
MSLNQENNLEPTGEFAASIQNFRSVIRHIAARETASPVAANWLAPARQRRRSAQRSMVLGWACAALLCLATLPLSTHSHPATPHPVAQAAASVVESGTALPDQALLDQVDTDVSESVPSSLAPLAELENLNTETTNTSGDSSK